MPLGIKKTKQVYHFGQEGSKNRKC